MNAILGRPLVDGEITITESGDTSIEAAVSQARETLPIFWEVFESQRAEQYQLKAGLTTPNGAVEHVWLRPSGWRDGRVVGTLAVEPSDLDDLSLGDEILVEADRISDWGYVIGGKLYGAFTQRALLDRLSPAVRRQVQAALSSTPLEAGAH